MSAAKFCAGCCRRRTAAHRPAHWWRLWARRAGGPGRGALEGKAHLSPLPPPLLLLLPQSLCIPRARTQRCHTANTGDNLLGSPPHFTVFQVVPTNLWPGILCLTWLNRTVCNTHLIASMDTCGPCPPLRGRHRADSDAAGNQSVGASAPFKIKFKFRVSSPGRRLHAK